MQTAKRLKKDTGTHHSKFIFIANKVFGLPVAWLTALSKQLEKKVLVMNSMRRGKG